MASFAQLAGVCRPTQTEPPGQGGVAELGLCSMSGMPIAVAHRGDPVSARENTMAAFESAIRAGADMIELDLQRCRDGEIVILHDPTLARLWEVDRIVADLDLADVRAIGSDDVVIPTLREVLDALSIPLMVDFTSGDVVAGAVAAVRDANATDRSLFVTGNVAALRTLRAIAPEARIGLTWTRPELPTQELFDELAAEFWNPMFRLVSEHKIEEIHSLGLKVSTWTVDDTGDMARLAAAGLDAIVSNRIWELRRVLEDGTSS